MLIKRDEAKWIACICEMIGDTYLGVARTALPIVAK